MSDFDTLRSIVSKWPNCEWAALTDPPESRLANALQQLQKTEGSVGPGDIAGLARHVLRSQALACENRGGQEDNLNAPFLKVPINPPWPTPDIWQQFGCRVSRKTEGFLEVTSEEWAPSWLGSAAPAKAAFLGESRVFPELVTADPEFSRLTGYQQYTSPGQREAVRSAFLLQPGRTLLINLPTGSGKSSVFQAPAVASAQHGQLSLIVMPTTALAKDQEARLQTMLVKAKPELGSVSLAYHSGLGSDLKDSFRKRIRSGEQVVVLASPEAILSGLRLALLDAARRGRLDWFVVDEAHVVEQWGTDFRPEFQLLAAFRDELQQLQTASGGSLKTLLLTATLTDSTLRTLKTLYGSPTLEVLSAIHIRPEPDYWVASAENTQEKKKWINEALYHLPRPLILYTTRRDAAEAWQKLVRDMGIHRVGLIRGGDSSTNEGGQLLRDWKAGEVDIMVATSAFGLGMDYDRVRAVIHACVPETIDRFYQEVGRGGRDGHATVSLMVYTQKDKADAKRLANKTIIGDEKGFEYWNAMWLSATEMPGVEDGWVVKLGSQPSHINWDASYVKTWNTRTLLLLARAGLIKLLMPPFNKKSSQDLDETDEHYESRIKSELNLYFSQAAFQLISPVPDNVDEWSDAVAGARKEISSSSQDAHDKICSVLTVERTFNSLFKDTYTLAGLRAVPSTPRGNCPFTRSRGMVDFNFVWPEPAPIRWVGSELASQLQMFAGPGPHWVYYELPGNTASERRNFKRRLANFIAAAISFGIDELAFSENLAHQFDLAKFTRNSNSRFLVVRDYREPDPESLDFNVTALQLSRITVLGPEVCTIPKHLFGIERPFHLVLLPESVRDSERPDRSFIETRECRKLDIIKEAWETCRF